MKSDNMTLKGVTLERLQDRVSLLKSFDTLDRNIDQRGVMDGMDAYNAAGPRHPDLVEARGCPGPVEGRPAKVVERYGVDDPVFERDGAPRMVRNFCIARRLVEAGARVVTLNFTPLGLARRRTARTSCRAARTCRCSTRRCRPW